MKVKDEFVFVKEAAEMLGVCPNTIRAWGESGQIVEYRHPVNRYRMFKRKELEKLIKQMNQPVKRPK